MTGANPSRPSQGAAGRAQQARQEASQVGHQAAQAGGQVAHAAAEQGGQVAAEARQQARHLTGEATNQLQEQARSQQQRAVDGLRGLGQGFHNMAERDGDSGLAGQAVRRAADAADRAAGWLDGWEPGEVLDDVRTYARQHPGTFLAGAAVAGLLVGRLTRGLTGGGGGVAMSSEPPPPQGETAGARPQPYSGAARAQNTSPPGQPERDVPGGVAP
ncbi:hypothetical protein ACWD6L_10235 [Micromonospora profundi]